MKRVAFYIDSLKLGGAERVTLQWASWCMQEGWDVTVITRRSQSDDVYIVPESVERLVEQPLASPLESLGWLGFPLRILKLHRLLKLGRYQLVVGITTLPAIKLLLASRALPLMCVVSERNFPPAKPPSLPWRLLRRLTYPWANLHLVQTQQTGAWLHQNCAVRKQLLLPNAVQWPLPAHKPRVDPAAVLPKGAALLLAAGTKAKQKGFDRLMLIFRQLAQQDPTLYLAIPGVSSTPYHGVDQQAWLRELLGSDPDLQRRLLLPGAVGNLADWYAHAAVFVLPSRYEGFPNVLLEAMAAGCACVAADCSTGPADLIRDGDNGLLLPSTAAPDAWVAAVRGLLVDPQTRDRLGQNARLVRENYSEVGLRRHFLHALEACADGR